MDYMMLKVTTCPSDALSYTNRAVVSTQDAISQYKHVEITNSTMGSFIFTVEPSPQIGKGTDGLQHAHGKLRKWALLSTNETLKVKPYNFDLRSCSIARITLFVDYMQKTNASESLNTDEMAKAFMETFLPQAFTVGQTMVFKFQDKKLLRLTVKEIEALSTDLFDPNNSAPKKTEPRMIKIGVTIPNTQVMFEKQSDSALSLTGQAKGKVVRQSIINPDWDFATMGIGGLDNEFNAIFRRAFASRVFPPEIIEELGIKHVRGILLFGPPGTGKTLMARQIGKMLNAREPKIVNGPQILDKYVGESEANIRKLFEDAEEEQKKMGINSGLHIIIFDEIDAICKARGSLLAKIDGVDSLNNILVIGMTNRRDMIDEALLRPGRMEQDEAVQEAGSNVDIGELATLTKNFSGAEIEGLVRAAQSTAMNRLVKATNKVELDPQAFDKLLVTREDFLHALENDIKPAFGTSQEAIERLICNGIICWDPVQVKSSQGTRGIVSILLEGAPNSGKTALAAKLAIDSDFPFIKLCSPDDMVGFTETAKCAQIRKVFDDAYKSTLSCILVDNIERLLDYGPIGPRYSNLVLQALMVLLKKEPPPGKKLLVLCTSSCCSVLREMGLLSTFTTVLHCPNLSKGPHLINVLQEMAKENAACFEGYEIQQIANSTANATFNIGIKKLIAYVDISKQMDPGDRVIRFLGKIEEESIHGY
ncbi:hypothetical protein TYRP_007369 [Tyrophagus putrescentiae]|nr:hypothetical protein TYRP_007369 [Tyrophagus putrescentiae]